MMLLDHHTFSTLALISCFALLLNLLLGGPAAFYQPLRFLHPLALWRGLMAMLERKLNRAKRDAKTRRRRGRFLLLIGVCLLVIIGVLLQEMFMLPGAEYMQILLLAVMLGARPTLDSSIALRRLLHKTPKQVTGKLLPAALIRREHKSYDHAAIVRATIELLALGFCESVIAPIVFFVLFGWVGVMLVCGIRVMDQLVGYTSTRSREFGGATAKCHSVLHWLPARLAAFWLAFSSLFAPSAAPIKSWMVMVSQASKTKSANAGWPLGAMAGALNLTLGGPRTLHGSYIADGWVGASKSNSQPQLADLKRAQWLYAVSHLLLVMLLLGLGVAMM